MGHHSIKVAVDIYGKLVPGANKAAVDRLDAEKERLGMAQPSTTPRDHPKHRIRGAGPAPSPADSNGGAEGDRTPDPETASLVLSQLSYSPVGIGRYRAGRGLVKARGTIRPLSRGVPHRRARTGAAILDPPGPAP